MDRDILLLQTNHHCVYKNHLYWVTEKNRMLVGIDTKTGIINVPDIPAFKERADYVNVINDAFYAVGMSGRWIAEVKLDWSYVTYFDIEAGYRDYSNFVYVTTVNDSIIMILKNKPLMYIFDTNSKKGEFKHLSIDGKAIIVDGGYTEDNRIWLLSGTDSICMVYDVNCNTLKEYKELSFNSTLDYVFSDGNNHFALSNNCIYNIDDSFKMVCKIDSMDLFCRAAITGERLWVLPQYKDELYVYNMGKAELEVYSDFPIDYCYGNPAGLSRFLGCCENDNTIFWSMRSNNYVLCIDKHVGTVKWLKPILSETDEEKIIKKSFLENDEPIKEEMSGLNLFLDYIITMKKER